MVTHVVRNTVPNTAEQRRNSPPRTQYPPLHITEHHPKRPEPADPRRPPPRARGTRGHSADIAEDRATPRLPGHAGRRKTSATRFETALEPPPTPVTAVEQADNGKTGAGDIPMRRSGRAHRMHGGTSRTAALLSRQEAVALNALIALIALVFPPLGHLPPCFAIAENKRNKRVRRRKPNDSKPLRNALNRNR